MGASLVRASCSKNERHLWTIVKLTMTRKWNDFVLWSDSSLQNTGVKLVS